MHQVSDANVQCAEERAYNVVSIITSCIDVLQNAFKERKSGKYDSKEVVILQSLERANIIERVESLNDDRASHSENMDVGDDESIEMANKKLVHRIFLPILHVLRGCYRVLDAVEPPTTKTKNPIPPPGMLSLKHYTDIACFIEWVVCSSLLFPFRPSVADRVRQLPASLAGRIPKQALLHCNLVEDTTNIASVYESIRQLVTLDRFRPMLLPRHAADLCAANLWLQHQRQSPQALELPSLLHARVLQALLIHKPKVWLKSAVGASLHILAQNNLEALVAVFTDKTTGSCQRLALTLAKGSGTELVAKQGWELKDANMLWALIGTLPEMLVEWKRILANCTKQEDLSEMIGMWTRLLSVRVPPSATMCLCQLLTEPMDGDLTPLHVLLHVASSAVVVVSPIKDAAHQCLVALCETFQEAQVNEYLNGLDWFAIALIDAMDSPLFTSLQRRLNEKALIVDLVGSEDQQQLLQNRAKFICQSFASLSKQEGSTKSVYSPMFSVCVRVYLDSLSESYQQVPNCFRSKSVSTMTLLLVMCDILPLEKLLIENPGDRNGIFDLMARLFDVCAVRFAALDIASEDGQFNHSCDTLSRALQSYVESNAQCRRQGEAHDVFNSADTEETVLVLASLLLNVLITILELGSKERSVSDNKYFARFELSLRPITGCLDIHGNCEALMATVCELASHAVALLAARSSRSTSAPSNKKVSVDHVQKLLSSEQPPLRAQGICELRHICMAQIVEGDFKSSVLVPIAVEALKDPESYVYLAAIHTLTIMAVFSPIRIVPSLVYAVASGKLSDEVVDQDLTMEQRSKLAEAVVFFVRRTASLDMLAEDLIELVLFGGTMTKERTAPSVLIHEKTSEYFSRNIGINVLEEDELSEQKVRLQTGGPVFQNEEEDLVSSSRLLIAAAVVSRCHPSIAARSCHSLVQACTKSLQLEGSRLLRRSGSYLAQSLYECVLCEAAEHTSCLFGMAMISSDEEELASALERCLAGDDLEDLQDTKRFYDAAMFVRCREALKKRQLAKDRGIFEALKIASEYKQRSENVPSQLIVVENEEYF